MQERVDFLNQICLDVNRETQALNARHNLCYLCIVHFDFGSERWRLEELLQGPRVLCNMGSIRRAAPERNQEVLYCRQPSHELLEVRCCHATQQPTPLQKLRSQKKEG